MTADEAGGARHGDEACIPVTPAAGPVSVLGGSVPVHGGVLLDLCGLTGIVDVDATSMGRRRRTSRPPRGRGLAASTVPTARALAAVD